MFSRRSRANSSPRGRVEPWTQVIAESHGFRAQSIINDPHQLGLDATHREEQPEAECAEHDRVNLRTVAEETCSAAGMEFVKNTVLIGPGEQYDLELTGDNPGVWMFHCHMENHAANGMMSLIQYDGAIPTGPVGEFFNPDGGMAPDGMRHLHSAPSSLPELVATPAPQGADPADATDPAAVGPVVDVTLLDDRFEPPALTIAAGTTLNFVNRGANWHSVAAFDGSFDSGRIDSGGTFAVRFDQSGEYRIICKHHGLRGMVGRVIVS